MLGRKIQGRFSSSRPTSFSLIRVFLLLLIRSRSSLSDSQVIKYIIKFPKSTGFYSYNNNEKEEGPLFPKLISVSPLVRFSKFFKVSHLPLTFFVAFLLWQNESRAVPHRPTQNKVYSMLTTSLTSQEICRQITSQVEIYDKLTHDECLYIINSIALIHACRCSNGLNHTTVILSMRVFLV